MKKNENYLKYVQAMQMLNEGKSFNYIEKHLKTNRQSIKLARQRYLIGGELALLQPNHRVQLSQERKLAIVQEVEEKQLSLLEVALKHLIPPHSLQRWVKAYRLFGEAGLARKGTSNGMKKKRQLTEAELDELEMLLKKVRALVEEREARLRAIGQKPSKN